MKKLISIIFMFLLTFFNLGISFAQGFTQGGFQSQNNEIRVSGSGFGSKKNIGFTRKNRNDLYFIQNTINRSLALLGLYVVGRFIVYPSFSNFKNIIYVGITSFAVNFIFAFKREY